MKTIAACTIALFIAFGSCRALAQEWTVTTSDFQTKPATLHSLSSSGIEVVNPGSDQPMTIPLDRFVSVQRSGVKATPNIAKFTLFLTGGDKVVGEPTRIANEELIWTNPALGEMAIPLRRLVAISRAANADLPAEAPRQDVVNLSNGDSVTGVVTDCSTDKIVIQTGGDSTPVPTASVTQIVFAAVADGSTQHHGYRVRLGDGSIVSAADASISGDNLSLVLPGKSPAREVALSQVVGIEQINGPVSWLSSRTPTENVQVPYFGGSPTWPAIMDASVRGMPITFAGHIFERGIGVHAYSRLTYAIEPAWTTFRTQYAIDSSADAPLPLADVTVRIKLDDKVVYEQPHVHAGTLSPVVSLSIEGKKAVTLEADFGDAGDTQDHLNWIESALVKR